MGKKKSKMQHNIIEETVILPGPDLLSTLPWELIAEILSDTSPKDILALARCSCHFCKSLVMNPRSKYIWEHARKTCNPPIPDPTPNLNESSYAAFLFDGGPCAECGSFTSNFYTSFSLRLRFCKHQCCSNWRGKNAVYREGVSADSLIYEGLLSSEGKSLCQQCQFGVIPAFFRLEDFTQARRAYEEFLGSDKKKWKNRQNLYAQLHKSDVKRNNEILAFSIKLLEWTEQRKVVARDINFQNDIMLVKISAREGWERTDLMKSPTCANWYKHHIAVYELLTEKAFKSIRAIVEAEVIEIVEKRVRSVEERDYARRRELVAQEYHRRRSLGFNGPNANILPTLSVFRDLPIIKTIQNKRGTAPKDVTIRFDEPSIQRMIDDNLSAWKDRTRKAFMKILGIKKYTVISDKRLDPMDRATARFLCSKCLLHHSSDETAVPPLDFKETCVHQCQHVAKKQRTKLKWSTDQFVKDEKAIKVTRKLLDLLCTSDDNAGSLVLLGVTRDRILCKSCDGRIVMCFKTMQQHAHRHEDMEIELLTAPAQREIKFLPIGWGLCADLMSMAKSAPRKAALQIYGCRHCLQYNTSSKAEGSNNTMQIDEKERPEQQVSNKSGTQKLLSFHGLRCHVLQRHGIQHIADEDIYRVNGKDIKKVSTHVHRLR